MLSINQLDIVFALIILLASIRGAVRGFVSEVLSMASVILAVAAAVLFSSHLAALISEIFGASIWSQVIAFLALFVVVYLIVKLLEGLLHSGVEKLHLRKLDRVLGFLLGIAEGFLVVFVALFLLHLQPFFDVRSLLQGSLFARFLIPLLVPAHDWLDSMSGYNPP